jgi:hypothetical protein
MTLVRLVHGGDAASREQAIVNEIPFGTPAVALLEGIAIDTGLIATDALTVIRIAPGCPCCTGNLTLRVTLNRLLRNPPGLLFMSLSDASHLESVQRFLHEEQYCGRLQRGPDLPCGRAPEIRA